MLGLLGGTKPITIWAEKKDKNAKVSLISLQSVQSEMKSFISCDVT